MRIQPVDAAHTANRLVSTADVVASGKAKLEKANAMLAELKRKAGERKSGKSGKTGTAKDKR